MKKIILLAMVSMLGLVLAGTVRGEEKSRSEGQNKSGTLQSSDASQTKSGTVTKVDVAAKQVVVMVTRDMTFSVTDTTKILQGTTSKKIGDIKVGAHVAIDYVRKGEARVATKITLSE